MTEPSTPTQPGQPEKSVELVEMVDALSDETKDLALNLALYLAKAKRSSETIRQMEPEFIRLVNSTVKVIQELTIVLNAAKNREKMVYQVPSGRSVPDHIESRLEAIAEQCNHR
jgi:sugar-specific transcriptional regulator TrmB